MTTGAGLESFVDRVADRLADRYERRARRWHLSLPTESTSAGAVRPLLLALGLPTLGLSFAVAILTTYGPVLLLRLTPSPTTVGVLIGGEGAFALVVPLIAGILSDRLPPSPLGRRAPFVLLGLPLVVAGLMLLPFAGSLPVAGTAILLFFVGYYAYYPPYRALYADVLPTHLYARGQGSQALLRGVGLGGALMAGGLLLGAWRPLPFLLAALVVVPTTAALGPVMVLRGAGCDDSGGTTDDTVPRLSDMLRNPGLRAFAAANALWEFSFAGLKSFIVLYVVRGLGRSPAMASAVIAVVAVAYVVGAPIAGRLSERYGMVRVMGWAAAVYGVGLCWATLPTSVTPLLVALPFVALAGAVLLTLPPALAFLVAPAGAQGAAAGLVDVSRGLGLVLGPVAVGAAITATHGWFPATHGYSAMWAVIGLAVLASLPLLRLLSRLAAGTTAG